MIPDLSGRDGSGGACDRREYRREASNKLLWVITIGLVCQGGGWAFASGHPAVEGGVVIGGALLISVSGALIVPRPPGGFRRIRDQQGASGGGFDRLGFASFLLMTLPWQITNVWAQSLNFSRLTNGAVVVGVAAGGAILMLGTVFLRRHLDNGPRGPVVVAEEDRTP